MAPISQDLEPPTNPERFKTFFEVHPNHMRPCLYLSDVVASAFFRASDIYQTAQHDPECAKLLAPRMARDPDTPAGMVHGFGVKLMPNLSRAKLKREQENVYRFYGYPQKQWWMPKADE